MITRKVDELGRIVVPMEVRRELGIELKTPIEISVEGSNIILRKNEGKCIICGSDKKLTDFKDKKVCKKCLEEIKNEFE